MQLRVCHFLVWTVIAGDCSREWDFDMPLKDGDADVATIIGVHQVQQSSKGEIYWLHDIECLACIRELYRGTVTSLTHICTYERASLIFFETRVWLCTANEMDSQGRTTHNPSELWLTDSFFSHVKQCECMEKQILNVRMDTYCVPFFDNSDNS